MPTINIPKNDHGKVYVFALSMSDDAAQVLHDNDDLTPTGGSIPQEQALGTKIDSTHVEVFRVADLEALGLAGYLREGIDVQKDEITRDAAKLAAVSGWVMVVYSKAFGDSQVTLNPIPELTLIGIYSQQQADQTGIALKTASAAPYTGAPSATPPTPPRGRASGSMVVVGLAVLVALILWWALG